MIIFYLIWQNVNTLAYICNDVCIDLKANKSLIDYFTKVGKAIDMEIDKMTNFSMNFLGF